MIKEREKIRGKREIRENKIKQTLIYIQNDVITEKIPPILNDFISEFAKIKISVLFSLLFFFLFLISTDEVLIRKQ